MYTGSQQTPNSRTQWVSPDRERSQVTVYGRVEVDSTIIDLAKERLENWLKFSTHLLVLPSILEASILEINYILSDVGGKKRKRNAT